MRDKVRNSVFNETGSLFGDERGRVCIRGCTWSIGGVDIPRKSACTPRRQSRLDAWRSRKNSAERTWRTHSLHMHTGRLRAQRSGMHVRESRARPHACNRKYRVPASENLSFTAAVRHLSDPLHARLTYALFLVAIALEFFLPILHCFEVLFPGDSLGPILGEHIVDSLEALKLHGVLNMAKGLSCPDTRTQSKCARAPRHKR